MELRNAVGDFDNILVAFKRGCKGKVKLFR